MSMDGEGEECKAEWEERGCPWARGVGEKEE